MRTVRTSLAPRRALAALAWRGHGSARRESGARRATACGRAVPFDRSLNSMSPHGMNRRASALA